MKDNYTKLVEDSCGDSKKLWKFLNLIFHLKSGSTLHDNSSNQNLGDKFPDYFIDKISRIHSAFPDSSTSSTERQNVIAPNFSPFSTVLEVDVRKNYNA